MKTIPETMQNFNHWLQKRDTQPLIPSISTDLENRQNSSAFPYAKTLGLKSLLNCLCAAETIKHTVCAELRKYLDESTTANPSNSIGLRHQQNLQPLAGENQRTRLKKRNAMRTELSILKSLLNLGSLSPESISTGLRWSASSTKKTDNYQSEIET